MKIITCTFAFALLAAPSMAQVSGSINRDAPTVSRSIKLKNGTSISASYVAIHFGEGKWQGALKNERMRERLNNMAPKKPIGSIETNVDVVASKPIPAGKYDLFFTVHEQFGWILNLKNQKSDAVIRFGMKMQEKKTGSRFSLSVDPGDKGDEASITIAFGGKAVTVPVKVAPKKAKNAK